MSEPYTKPFKGLTFDRNKIDDIATCVCPPYDVIESAAVYYERNRYNAVRLELPLPQGSMDSYTAARTTLEDWLKSGILVQDSKDTAYVYQQEFTIQNHSCSRKGFIALNKLDKGRILTHEQTRSKAKQDRERLIGTLKTFTSLVFGLYEDKEGLMEEVLADAHMDKLYDFTDEQFIQNRFYRMTDSEEIARLTGLMDERPIYIADGHHRLDVSYRLGISHIPVYLTNMYSPGIVILPYHRTIKFIRSRSVQELLNLLRPHAYVSKEPLSGPDPLKSLLKRIASAERPTYGFYSKDDTAHMYIVASSTPLFDGEEIPESLMRLKVNILHSGLLKKTLHIQDEEISFTQDPYDAVEQVRTGGLDLAVLLPPTTVQEVKDIADNGLYMPPKSTFFYPKILTGLVFHRYR